MPDGWEGETRLPLAPEPWTLREREPGRSDQTCPMFRKAAHA